VGAQATRSRGESSAGPKQAGRAALCSRQASLWGGVGGYTARQGTEGRGQPPVTRGEANKVSRAPERLGWRCMHYMQAQVRVRLGWRSTD